MDHSDSELVRRSLRGEQEAFAAIYDRYARLVRVVCFETTENIPDAFNGDKLLKDAKDRAYSITVK